MNRLFVALHVGLAIVAASGSSRAETPVERCLSAHEHGQRSALEGKLTVASEDYRVCGESHCPKLVREDCKRRLELAQAELPTLRLVARGAEDVTVRIDGADAVPLDSGPVPVDAGEHRIVFESADGRRVERSIQARKGEHDREVIAEFAAPEPAPSEPEPQVDGAPTPTAVYVLGGVAVVGIAGFAYFGLAGNSKRSDLDACKPKCDDPSVYDGMKRDYLLADVSLGIGVVSAAVATYLYVHRDRSGGEQQVAVHPTPRGGLLTWGGTF